MEKILISGLGGGLDIVNALPLYFAAKNQGHEVVLASSRRRGIENLVRAQKVSPCSAWINGHTFRRGKNNGGRFAEARIAKLLNERILYLAREVEGNIDHIPLREEIKRLREEENIQRMFFVDGGGDSLVLRDGDAIDESEEQNPFEGGDAIVLEALANIPDIYLGVVAVGLDMNINKFQYNLAMLNEIQAYHGKIDLRDTQKENPLNHLFRYTETEKTQYLALARKILVLTRKDLGDQSKVVSHTAPSVYRAINGEFGRHRTYSGLGGDEREGIEIIPKYSEMHFFSAGKIHPLKEELNDYEPEFIDGNK